MSIIIPVSDNDLRACSLESHETKQRTPIRNNAPGGGDLALNVQFLSRRNNAEILIGVMRDRLYGVCVCVCVQTE